MAKKWTRGSWAFPRATRLLKEFIHSVNTSRAWGLARPVPAVAGPWWAQTDMTLLSWSCQSHGAKGEQKSSTMSWTVSGLTEKRKSLAPRTKAVEPVKVHDGERKFPDCLSWRLWHYLGEKGKENLLKETEYAKVLWPEVVPGGFEEVKEDLCAHKDPHNVGSNV